MKQSAKFPFKLSAGNKQHSVTMVKMGDNNSAPKSMPIHHVILMDGSGSMYPYVNKIVQTVRDVVSQIDQEDIITLIQFRGVDDFTVHLKHVTNNARTLSYIDNLNNVRGTTCFSSPLQEVIKVVDEDVSKTPIMISLFTDGDPVVPWSSREELLKVSEAILKIWTKTDVLAVNTFGYGNNYDDSIIRELSSNNAQSIFAHLASIDHFSERYYVNYRVAKGTSLDKKYLIHADNGAVRVSGQNVFFVDNLTEQFYQDGDVFYLLDGVDNDAETIEAAQSDIKNGLHAIAAYFQYTGRSDVSLEIISDYLKDQRLANIVEDAFTKEERQRAVNELILATVDPTKRLVDGELQVTNANDSKSVFALLKVLSDNGAKYLPYHQVNEKYERVGKKAEYADYQFKTDQTLQDTSSSQFSDLVWNDKRVNLSILTRQQGYIELDAEDQKLFSVTTIPSFVWKNRTIIKDGALNIRKLIVQIDNIVPYLEYMHGITSIVDNVYSINLDNYPIISKKDYVGEIDSSSTYHILSEIAKIKTGIKVLRSKLPEKESHTTSVFDTISEKYDIQKDGSYSSKVAVLKNEDSDFYIAKDFKFYLKGMDTIPKVESKPGSKAPGQMLMNITIEFFDRMTDVEEIEKCIVLAKKTLKEYTNCLAFIRLYLCLTKKSLNNLEIVGKDECFVLDKESPAMVVKTERTKVYY